MNKKQLLGELPLRIISLGVDHTWDKPASAGS